MIVIYRISDGGNPKDKPEYVTKKGVFQHFCKIFSNHVIIVIGDNISDDTYNFLLNHIQQDRIIKTQLGNSQSFMFALNLAIQNFSDEEKIYFAEDDYIYKENAPVILSEGLDIADYCSGYDHPDKYINTIDGGDNPYIRDGGELSRVVISKSSHWKTTNSLCMTFGAKVKTLKMDFGIFKHFCNNGNPLDFYIFSELNKIRKIISSIPAVCTHGETKYLAPFVDWKSCIQN